MCRCRSKWVDIYDVLMPVILLNTGWPRKNRTRANVNYSYIVRSNVMKFCGLYLETMRNVHAKFHPYSRIGLDFMGIYKMCSKWPDGIFCTLAYVKQHCQWLSHIPSWEFLRIKFQEISWNCATIINICMGSVFFLVTRYIFSSDFCHFWLIPNGRPSQKI